MAPHIVRRRFNPRTQGWLLEPGPWCRWDPKRPANHHPTVVWCGWDPNDRERRDSGPDRARTLGPTVTWCGCDTRARAAPPLRRCPGRPLRPELGRRPALVRPCPRGPAAPDGCRPTARDGAWSGLRHGLAVPPTD